MAEKYDSRAEVENHVGPCEFWPLPFLCEGCGMASWHRYLDHQGLCLRCIVGRWVSG